MKNVHKTYIKFEAQLMKELIELRKGSGLTPVKLQDKAALRALASRLTNLPETNLTGSRLYTFLLSEIERITPTRNVLALRNAFNVDQKSVNALSARRAAFATRLGKHPDTIERYENHGAVEFASYLVTLLSNEPIAPMSSKPPYLQHLEEQVSKARAATVLGLSGILSLEERTEELIGFLESLPRLYLDTSIEVAFLPSSRGERWYRMTVAYSFKGRRDTFRLAVVTMNEDGDLWMKRGLIDEFHKLNEGIDPTRETRGVINSNRLTLRNPNTGQQKSLRFRETNPERMQQFLQSVGEPLRGSFRLLEITIPPAWQTPHTLYEYSSSINLRDDVHYAYWYAPSLMYVKKLSFDYSKFPAKETWQFTTLPFLGHIAGEVLDRDNDSFVLNPNSWIMPGHGIGLTWE